MDRLGSALQPRIGDLLRAATAVFFVSTWVLGNVILTPELKTDNQYIPWIQAAIAVGMFWRSTLILSAIGIFFLFGFSIFQYGLFHLMDYPIFLGLALYHGLSGLERRPFGLRPLDFARWGAAITLMWASVEKWAYPQWSYPLLQEHPNLAMGLDLSFYMITAGAVEFVLAFALLWTPLVRRSAAIILLGMFIGAIFEFGKIDAIGHLMIIAIILAIAFDNDKNTKYRPVLAPIYFFGALICTIAAYYGSHSILVGALAAP
jgi:hypothetical protein